MERENPGNPIEIKQFCAYLPYKTILKIADGQLFRLPITKPLTSRTKLENPETGSHGHGTSDIFDGGTQTLQASVDPGALSPAIFSAKFQGLKRMGGKSWSKNPHLSTPDFPRHPPDTRGLKNPRLSVSTRCAEPWSLKQVDLSREFLGDLEGLIVFNGGITFCYHFTRIGSFFLGDQLSSRIGMAYSCIYRQM